MDEKTLIIHGWSDSSASFQNVKSFLADTGLGPVESIYFGDYESREDSLTFHDVADGLNTRLREEGFIDADGNKKTDLNVVVHSTGGLVIRHWIWRYYLRDGDRIDRCPVRRLVMLAPANFGSPLAHRGKSFLGSMLKGRWEWDDFLEVGKNFLHGLELASPYQWELAHHDLVKPESPYRPERIKTTILVGVEGYSGLVRSYVNKPGTDGTVTVSGTPLNSVKLTMDCTGSGDDGPLQWHIDTPNANIAFGILPTLNHGSIVSQIGTGGQLDDLLSAALQVHSDQGFSRLREQCEETSTQAQDSPDHDVYQQFHVHALDDQEQPITDYSLEFRITKTSKIEQGVLRNVPRSQAEDRYSARVHEALTRHVHTHTQDSSHRRLLISHEEFSGIVQEARREIGEPIGVAMRIHVPDIDEGIVYDTDNLQNIIIHQTDDKPSGRPTFFYPNTTTLVELRVNRDTRRVWISREPRTG